MTLETIGVSRYIETTHWLTFIYRVYAMIVTQSQMSQFAYEKNKKVYVRTKYINFSIIASVSSSKYTNCMVYLHFILFANNITVLLYIMLIMDHRVYTQQ